MARKKNLDEINSAAEKKTGNSVKRRSTNTVQNPTSTTKKDIQEIRSTVNNLKGLSSYQKKRTSTANNQVVESTKKTDEEIIKEYESIPNHNILSRGFSGVSTPGAGRPATQAEIDYNRKQELQSDYQQAKNRQIANFLSANNISDSTLSSLSSKHQSSGKNTRVSDYNRIKKLADAAGIDMKDVINYGEASAAHSTKEALTDYADKHGVIGTVASVPMNILGTVENLKTEAGNYLSGKPIGSNEAVNARSDMAGNIRNAVSENIENPIGKLAYNVGTSIADYAALMPLGSGLALAGMGVEAASGTLNDMKDKNVTPNQMIGTAAMSGLIEVLTEKIPLENLFKVAKSGGKQTVKQIIGNVLKQAGVEGTEEGISELANAFADNVINQDESDWNQSINQYMLYGMTQSQAENQARKDLAGRALQSALTGAVSGGIMAGGASAFANANSNIITPEQFQANEEYIQRLKSINDGQNYLDSYNERAEKVPDMRDLSTFQNGVSSDSQNNVGSDAYEEMLERVQAVPRNGFEQKTSDDIKNSHPTGVDATNTPQPLRPEQSVGKAMEADNTASISDSIPNSEENVNEAAQNVQYNGKKIDGFDDLNKDLDRLIGMYKGNENTQSLYEQMKSAVNEYVQTYNQDAIDRAITLASDIDGTLVGHSYTRKGSGKNSSKSQNNRVTTDFAEGDFIDTLLSYSNELRNMAKTNSESEKQNNNVNTDPVRNTYVEQTAQFGDKVSQTRKNTIENSGMASSEELQKYHSPEKFTYESISEEESINRATDKLNKYGQDYISDLLYSDNQNISGSDIDALMMEYRRLSEQARKSGSDTDWNNAQDILKKVQLASTRNAQALQALAKWSRNTPEGQLAQANTAVEQSIEKTFGRKRTQKARESVERVYKAAKSGNTEKLEYELDKLNIDKNSIKQIALELGSKSSNQVKSEYVLDNVNIDNSSIEQGSLDLGNKTRNNTKVDYALDNVGIDENSIKQNNIDLGDTKNVTRNTVIDLLAKEGKINQKLAESLKEDTATQRKVLDMLDQMYDVGVDTYAGQVIMARVGKLLSSKVKHTVGDKVRQILYNNMLGNFRTLISRNAGGNVAVATMEQARQPLAATIDRAVSHFTGKRTTTGWSKEKQLSYIKGFAKGITEEFRDVKNTLSEYKNGQSTGLHTAKSGENNIINAIKNNDSAFKGNNILSKFINFKNDMVKHGLSMGDRPFYEATKAQAKTEIKQLLKQGYDIDTDELNLDEYIDQASSLIALEAVYQGDTELSNGFQKIRNGLAEMTEGMIGTDIMSTAVVPFVKTPSNVLDMALEYSPFGAVKNLVKTVYETKTGDFNQRRFVDETSRNIVGTLLLSACVLAYSAGHLTGGYDDDKDVKNAQKSAGMQEYALSFDDGKKNFDVGWVPVLGSSVEAGAAYGDARENGAGFLGATGAAMSQTAQSIFDQSMLESLSNLLGGNSYKDENFLTNAAKSAFGSYLGMLPSSLGRQIAQSTDKYERNLGTYGTNEYYINSVLNSIPGARQLLDVKYDNEGNPVLQNQGRSTGSKILENMLLPGKLTDVNYSELSSEAMRLYDSTGEKKQFVPTASKTDITTDEFTPTTNEINTYKKVLGENNSIGSAALMDSDFYNSLDDNDKVEYLAKIYSDMKQISKKEIIPNYTYPDSYKTKMEMYDEFGIEGLVNYYYITKESEGGGLKEKVTAIDNLDITDEEKGEYIGKLINISNSATAIQRAYGDAGLYQWYSMRSKVDSESDMPYQIVQSGMPYEDMLNYASVLYEDGKEKTAREKAADALQKAQDNLSSYQLRQTIKSLRKSYEDENAKKEQSIQDKLSNISGGSSYGGLLEYIKELRKSRSGGSDLISHIESLRKEYNSSQNSNPLTPIGIQ